MARISRVAVGLVICFTSGASVPGREPPEKPKAKVEFRWLESGKVPELTEENGIRTTCGNQLSYLHKKAILTHFDVAEARLSKHEYPFPIGTQFWVDLPLTKEAKTKLAAAYDDNRTRQLAIVVDGEYVSSWYFDKAKAADFVPGAGYIKSQTQAERIVEACNSPAGPDANKEKK